jgi:hypothetical protein
MTLYARINPDTQRQEVRDFAAAPSFDKGWRPLTVEVEPTPGPTQYVVASPIVFGPLTATQGWQLIEKTADQLEVDSILAERAALDAIITDLQAQRAVDRATWDAYTANQLRAEQWRDRQVLLRMAMLVARSMKQGLR